MSNKKPQLNRLSMLLTQMDVSLEHFSFQSGLSLDALLHPTEDVYEQCIGICEIIDKVYPWFESFHQCWIW